MPVRATRVQRLSLTELRDRAAAVLVLDVIDVSARAGDAGMVWTDYRARVHETLGGTQIPGLILTLRFAGGRAEGRSVGIDGVPRLQPGSRYVIFLDATAGRPVPAVGWGQGLFLVETVRGAGRLASPDGTWLSVDEHGTIGRSKRMTSRPMLPDPAVRNGDGSVPDQEFRPTGERGSRHASLDDLRRFVRHEIRERSNVRFDR